MYVYLFIKYEILKEERYVFNMLNKSYIYFIRFFSRFLMCVNLIGM